MMERGGQGGPNSIGHGGRWRWGRRFSGAGVAISIRVNATDGRGAGYWQWGGAFHTLMPQRIR